MLRQSGAPTLMAYITSAVVETAEVGFETVQADGGVHAQFGLAMLQTESTDKFARAKKRWVIGATKIRCGCF